MKKLTPEKKAAKTAKFQATMARKRAMKQAVENGGTVGEAMEIALDAIPDRAPARKGSRTAAPGSTDRAVALTLLRLALRLLEGKA